MRNRASGDMSGTYKPLLTIKNAGVKLEQALEQGFNLGRVDFWVNLLLCTTHLVQLVAEFALIGMDPDTKYWRLTCNTYNARFCSHYYLLALFGPLMHVFGFLQTASYLFEMRRNRYEVSFAAGFRAEFRVYMTIQLGFLYWIMATYTGTTDVSQLMLIILAVICQQALVYLSWPQNDTAPAPCSRLLMGLVALSHGIVWTTFFLGLYGHVAAEEARIVDGIIDPLALLVFCFSSLALLADLTHFTASRSSPAYSVLPLPMDTKHPLLRFLFMRVGQLLNYENATHLMLWAMISAVSWSLVFRLTTERSKFIL